MSQKRKRNSRDNRPAHARDWIDADYLGIGNGYAPDGFPAVAIGLGVGGEKKVYLIALDDALKLMTAIREKMKQFEAMIRQTVMDDPTIMEDMKRIADELADAIKDIPDPASN